VRPRAVPDRPAPRGLVLPSPWGSSRSSSAACRHRGDGPLPVVVAAKACGVGVERSWARRRRLDRLARRTVRIGERSGRLAMRADATPGTDRHRRSKGSRSSSTPRSLATGCVRVASLAALLVVLVPAAPGRPAWETRRCPCPAPRSSRLRSVPIAVVRLQPRPDSVAGRRVPPARDAGGASPISRWACTTDGRRPPQPPLRPRRVHVGRDAASKRARARARLLARAPHAVPARRSRRGRRARENRRRGRRHDRRASCPQRASFDVAKRAGRSSRADAEGTSA
jgi:hypothetical protein